MSLVTGNRSTAIGYRSPACRQAGQKNFEEIFSITDYWLLMTQKFWNLTSFNFPLPDFTDLPAGRQAFNF
jgi:hypothetical protein